VRELPRKLTAEQLAELFQGRTRLVERLAAVEDPLSGAEEMTAGMPEAEKLEALDAHPAIGRREGLSARSKAEQGDEEDLAVLAELTRLNEAYERKFGFRFVVFVNRRRRSEIVPILRERLERSRAEELETAMHELVAIARDRWQHA
jgi:2-oxo-4-hydroxy-4-carboxy--5-ureidoimidazoline (OHCU) decarboxylase